MTLEEVIHLRDVWELAKKYAEDARRKEDAAHESFARGMDELDMTIRGRGNQVVER